MCFEISKSSREFVNKNFDRRKAIKKNLNVILGLAQPYFSVI